MRRGRIAHYLAGDPEPLIIADWPEDIAQFNMLLVTGPGIMVDVPGAHASSSCR